MRRSRLRKIFRAATLAVLVAAWRACTLTPKGGAEAPPGRRGGTGTVENSPLTRGLWPVTLAVLAVALLALAACGMKPSPGPSTSWTPGASPVPAITYPPQAGTTAGFRAGTEGWYFEPTVDIEVTAWAGGTTARTG